MKPSPSFTLVHGYHWLSYKQKTSYNQLLATDKQEIHYWVRVSQGERKPPQTEDTHDNSSTVFIRIEARASIFYK